MTPLPPLRCTARQQGARCRLPRWHRGRHEADALLPLNSPTAASLYQAPPPQTGVPFLVFPAVIDWPRPRGRGITDGWPDYAGPEIRG